MKLSPEFSTSSLAQNTHQSCTTPSHSFDQRGTALLLFTECICKEKTHPHNELPALLTAQEDTDLL